MHKTVTAFSFFGLFLVAAGARAAAFAEDPPKRSPIIVIDAGHGGSNTGAASRTPGRYEKQVTLSIARALQTRLERDGLRVVLTRDGDEYLTLRERSRRANAAGGDCFISLHTNASPDHSRHGVETYV